MVRSYAHLAQFFIKSSSDNGNWWIIVIIFGARRVCTTKIDTRLRSEQRTGDKKDECDKIAVTDLISVLKNLH